MPPKKGGSKSKSKKSKKNASESHASREEPTEDVSMHDVTEEKDQVEERPAAGGSVNETTGAVIEEVRDVSQVAIEESKKIIQSVVEGVKEITFDAAQRTKETAQAAVERVKENADVAAADFVEAMDPSPEPSTMTLEERTEKLKQLRLRMRQSAKDNRVDLITESQKVKTTAREVARLEKQRKLHELLRLKAEAEDRGEDTERTKNWGYTIEENDEWEKRLKRKKGRADFEFHDDVQSAQRKYKKDLDYVKPDLATYNAQKEAALGYQPGTLITGSSAVALNQAGPVTTQQRMAVENLYRDANSLLYADNKPSEEAIDRVVTKLNIDLDKRGKRSRKRANDDEGDITYINERNRVFNKKIARYYDKYTTEIRASFERGTAL